MNALQIAGELGTRPSGIPIKPAPGSISSPPESEYSDPGGMCAGAAGEWRRRPWSIFFLEERENASVAKARNASGRCAGASGPFEVRDF